MKTYSCPNSLKTSRLIAINLETTGLNPIFNTIIELGIIEVKNGEIVQQYSKLFGGGRSSMHQVRKVHGIRDAERLGKPTFKKCAKRIADYFSGAVLVSCNGNKFDIPFMKEKMKEAGVSLLYSRHIDTDLISRKLKSRKNDLEWLCRLYDIPYDGSHRGGLAKCHCTLQLLYAFCEKFGEDQVLES